MPFHIWEPLRTSSKRAAGGISSGTGQIGLLRLQLLRLLHEYILDSLRGVTISQTVVSTSARRLVSIVCLALFVVTAVTGGIAPCLFTVFTAVDELFGDIPSVQIVVVDSVVLPVDPS